MRYPTDGSVPTVLREPRVVGTIQLRFRIPEVADGRKSLTPVEERPTVYWYTVPRRIDLKKRTQRCDIDAMVSVCD